MNGKSDREDVRTEGLTPSIDMDDEQRVGAAGAGVFSLGNAATMWLANGAIAPVQVGVDAASEAICGNPSAEIVAGLVQIGFGVLATYFFLKGTYRIMKGEDMKGSPKQSEVQEGRDLTRGGIRSIFAALIPGLVVAVVTATGLGVVQCLVPGVGDGGGGAEAIEVVGMIATTLL